MKDIGEQDVTMQDCREDMQSGKRDTIKRLRADLAAANARAEQLAEIVGALREYNLTSFRDDYRRAVNLLEEYDAEILSRAALTTAANKSE